MLQIDPVSKFSKLSYTNSYRKKTKEKIQTINTHVGQAYTLQELGHQTNDQEIPYEQRQFQDAQLTKFLYQQLITIRLTMSFLGMTSILLSFAQALSSFQNIQKSYVLILHSVISSFLVLLVCLKHCKCQQLQRKQLIQVKRPNIYLHWTKAVGWQSLVLLVHPNLLMEFVVIQIQEPIYGTMTPFYLNNMLQMVMLSRIYLLYSALVNSSIYCTPRASRVCRIYSTKQEDNFGLKSVFNTHPLLCLLVLFISLVLVLSLMLKLAEQNNPDFTDVGNAIWCIIITMGTVGYGDYTPASYLGRLVAFIAAICGIIMISLLILTLSDYLAMSKNQGKAHLTLRRLQLRRVLQGLAQETVLATSAFGAGGDDMSELRKKTRRVKGIMRRLRNMVEGDNLSEEVNYMFEALHEHFMQVYLQQKRYAADLMELKEREGSRIQEINFTFAGEIEDIIRDH